jgi:Uma2 family endonuclease
MIAYSPAEYLAIERAARERHEYYQGELFAMAGASIEHDTIRNNLIGFLWQSLRDRPFRAAGSDLRVKVSATGLYTYPDVVIACDPLEFEDEAVDTLLNPRAIIEVLSPSTEGYDRGEKFRQYEQITSLLEYVLVEQDVAVAERFVREPGKNWTRVVHQGLDAELEISCVNIFVPLTAIFDRVL